MSAPPSPAPAADISSSLPTSQPTLNAAPHPPSSQPDPSSDSDSAIEDLLDDAHLSSKLYPSDLIPTYSSEDLTPRKIERDPILSRLARAQSVTRKPVENGAEPRPVFRARPAPQSVGNPGPKMTKAAALRQGKNWDEIKAEQRATSGTALEKERTEAPKRVVAVPASLAAPTMAPRQNKAAMLRAGLVPAETKRDPDEIAATNKARADAEREKLRQSVVSPPSLAAPSIMPRANKASALRTGAPPSSFATPFPRSSSSVNLSDAGDAKLERRRSIAVASLSQPSIVPRANKASALRAAPGAPGMPRSESQSALTQSSAANRGKPMTTQERAQQDKAERLARRSSVAGTLKSLAAPSIAPRLNRAAMLRAPGVSQSDSSSSLAHAASETGGNVKPPPVRTSTSGGTGQDRVPPSPSVASRKFVPPSPVITPKPNRASLLRQGLGAKVGH